MRTIKELLQLMLDNKQLFKVGLCNWCDRLLSYNLIIPEERLLLRKYINNNKPYSLHRLFFNDLYYWKVYDIKPRIKWLKKHISIN